MMAQRLESTTSIARARSTAALFNLTTSLGQIAGKSWHLKSFEAWSFAKSSLILSFTQFTLQFCTLWHFLCVILSWGPGTVWRRAWRRGRSGWLPGVRSFRFRRGVLSQATAEGEGPTKCASISCRSYNSLMFFSASCYVQIAIESSLNTTRSTTAVCFLNTFNRLVVDRWFWTLECLTSRIQGNGQTSCQVMAPLHDWHGWAKSAKPVIDNVVTKLSHS